MTPSDFAAWLRGFMDAIDGVPSPSQFERIRAELAKVGDPAKEPEPVKAVPAKEPEPVVLGEDLKKFLDEIQKYPSPVPPMCPWPTVPITPTYPWETQPSWPGLPYIWCTADNCGGGTYQ